MEKTIKPQYSVIIPTYNEASKEDDMKNHLNSIKEYFEKRKLSFEILIALDGPTDETPNLVKKYAAENKNIRVIDRKINHGKGYTVREGMLAAEGSRRLFTDMDGATPIDMLDRMIPEMDNGADLVIGSRDMSESEIKKHQPFWKEWLGTAGNVLIQIIGGLWGIRDTQCGFKMLTEKAVKDIMPRTLVSRWGIDFEILIIGKKLGYQTIQVPVEWIDKGDSLVGVAGYIGTFKDLFSVRFNLIKGVYQLNKKQENIKNK